MITSVMEILDLPNFGHMIKSTVDYDSRNKNLLTTSWTEIMTS